MGKRSRRRVKPHKTERVPFVARAFEGLPGECDWVALREIVPAASASITLAADGRAVRVCSLLPSGSPGLVRQDGELWVGLQVQHDSGDASRDVAAAIELGLDTEPGNEIAYDTPGPGPRLQDLIAPDSGFEVTVHDGFSYWSEGVDDPDGSIAESLEAANDAVAPTVKLDGVDAAYWTRMGDRQFLRWVMPYEEERLLDALARLRAGDADRLGPASRLIGSFRAYGLLVPVWEMSEGDAADLEEPAAAFATRLDEALADASALTSEQRSARNGLASRQLTIR